MQQLKKKTAGISLVEMIIAVVILTLITTLAVPSYRHYLRQTHRTDATVALLDLAATMELYYAENSNSYLGANLTSNLGFTSVATTHGYYTLSIPAVSAAAYTLQATPVTGKSQAADSACASFTLTQTGQKGITGTGIVSNCWGQ